MTKGKSIMDNSILPILPGIHATILSIIFAVVIIFFFYSYQVLGNLNEQMNDLRTNIAKRMTTPVNYHAGRINYQEYFEDDSLDLEKIRNDLLDLCPISVPEEIREEMIKAGINVRLTKEEVVDKALRILDIINIMKINSPYIKAGEIDGKGIKYFGGGKRLEYDARWKNDLISLNGDLYWIWKTRGKEILQIMSKFTKFYMKEEAQRFKAAQQKIMEKTNKNGEKSEEDNEIAMLNQYKFEVDFNGIVIDFFNRVKFIEENIVPTLKDSSYKLDFYENKFKIKTHLLTAFIVTISILVLGIFLPLVIHLWSKPPYIKGIELGLLTISLLPYLCLLLYYLMKTLQLKFR